MKEEIHNIRTTIEPPHDKTNKMTVHPAKTLTSLGIRPVWSAAWASTQSDQSLRCALNG